MDVHANHKLSIQKQQRITETITDVSVDWLTGHVRILPSESNEIRIIQLTNGKLSEAKLFHVEVIGGRLSIVDGRKRAFKLGLHFSNTVLEVYLPKAQLKSLSLISSGGHLEIVNLNADRCKCNTTSGSVQLSGTIEELELHTVGSPVRGESITCHTLYIRAISSKIDLYGSYTELDAHTSGRGLMVRSSTMLTRIRSVSTAGPVVISIPENDGFTLRFKKVSGPYKSDFPLEKTQDVLVYKDGGSSFEAEVRGGSFTIQKG
ncbi:DUF4097 family beta strand repeat-containing protein [Paenibacillus sp. NPDC058071]|uniref:DUF4097 family beta strand repeat-containing protein n=1 Tax=Paenibacillus sp. NPDC058071 TaxID=3346326 RepID=UPI0036DB67C4